jgi:Flp pilus assembly protein TadD
MSVGERESGQLRLGKHRGVLLALSAALMTGACAQVAELPLPGQSQQPQATASAQDSAQPTSELDRAVAYWGEQYEKNPRDKNAAISFARNLKADGQKQRALGVLQQASIFHSHDRELASEFGRLALEFDQVALAQKLLTFADDPVKPDWRVISARGTVLAKQGDYKGAIPFYERALKVSPNQASVVNNLAMAHAANGEPNKAEPLLRSVARDSGADPKIQQNLALVLGLQGKYDEAKHMARANLPEDSAVADVEYLRRMVKLEPQSSGAGTALASSQPAAPALRSATIAPEKSGAWDTRVAQAAGRPTLKPSQR